MSKNISFVTATEIEEKRKRRQEEWDKTRKDDDPEEAPEEQYDPRTLYERLQEQKMKKQEAFEESKKLKNLIKGLDNDEIEFLQAIDTTKAEYENQKYQEELLAIEEYKRGVTDLTVEDQEKRLLEFKRELFQLHKKKNENDDRQTKRKAPSQAELLSKVIKRKAIQGDPKDTANCNKAKGDNGVESVETSGSDLNKVEFNSHNEATASTAKPVMLPNMPTIQCIGRLPGIGCYDDNSDSLDTDRESDEDDVEDFQVFADPKEAREH